MEYYKQIVDFPNYEMSSRGYIRNRNTLKRMKSVKNKNDSFSSVYIKNANNQLKRLHIGDLDDLYFPEIPY